MQNNTSWLAFFCDLQTIYKFTNLFQSRLQIKTVNTWKIDKKEMVTVGITRFLLVVNIYKMKVKNKGLKKSVWTGHNGYHWFVVVNNDDQ